MRLKKKKEDGNRPVYDLLSPEVYYEDRAIVEKVCIEKPPTSPTFSIFDRKKSINETSSILKKSGKFHDGN
jgi:hypothetical protein